MKKFFGESAEYDKGEEDEAIEYLRSWKKFFLRKLNSEVRECNFVDEDWIHRGPEFSGILSQRSSIALKICVESKYFYELEPR